MKKIALILILTAAALQLKAQQLTQPLHPNSFNVPDKGAKTPEPFKLNDSTLFKQFHVLPNAKEALAFNMLKNSFANTDLFYSNMPVVKLDGNTDRMPVVKTGGNIDRMPIKKIKVVPLTNTIVNPTP